LGVFIYRRSNYEPALGRFLTEDPYGGDINNPMSLINKYSYVSNNPQNFIDPSGMVRLDIGGLKISFEDINIINIKMSKADLEAMVIIAVSIYFAPATTLAVLGSYSIAYEGDTKDGNYFEALGKVFSDNRYDIAFDVLISGGDKVYRSGGRRLIKDLIWRTVYLQGKINTIRGIKGHDNGEKGGHGQALGGLGQLYLYYTFGR
jgi:RHS repeat-associated protein